MITGPADARRRRRPFATAFVLSLVFHAVVLPLLLWLVGLSALIQPPKPRELIVSSTALRIERLPVPQPRSVSASAPHTRTPLMPHLSRPLHVLSRESPNAPPQPTRSQRKPTPAERLDQQLARERVAFSHEVARLNAADNPKSLATLSPRSPASYQKSYFDVSGSANVFAGHGVLIPRQHWFDGDRSCYYVRYTFEYPDGASEDGDVPWPICYPRNADQLQEPPHPIALPTPMPGFRVAVGTYLTPLIRYYYDHFQGKPPQGN